MDTEFPSGDGLPDWASDMWGEILEGESENGREPEHLEPYDPPASDPGFRWKDTPGVTGEVMRWILSNALYPQPELSAAAALAFMSVVKAHKVRTETDLRTNLLIASIGLSGSGKNWPLIAVRKLCDACNIAGLLLPEPSSDAALLSDLATAQGRGLLLWDEYGDALKQLTAATASSYQREILVLMKKLFSSASCLFKGKSAVTRDSSVVKQPCLSVLGASTPERLYSALSSNLVEDGFLSRFIFIEPEALDPPPRFVSYTEPPGELIVRISQILRWPTNSEKQPGGSIFEDVEIKPRIVPLTSEARVLLAQYSDYFREHMKACGEKEELMRAVWARGLEHTLKVALTVTDGTEIGLLELGWSFELVSDCLTNLISKFDDRVSESVSDKHEKRVLQCVKRRGRVTHSDLIRVTKGMSARERKDAIATLIESNEIVRFAEKLNGSRQRTVIYALSNE